MHYHTAPTQCAECPETADLNDDATGEPLCAACWLKRYPNG